MKKTRNVSLISQWVVQPGHSLSRAECHISRGVFLSLGRRRLTDRIEKHTTSGVNSISLYIYTTTIHKQRIGLKIHEKKDEKKMVKKKKYIFRIVGVFHHQFACLVLHIHRLSQMIFKYYLQFTY